VGGEGGASMLPRSAVACAARRRKPPPAGWARQRSAIMNS